MKQLFISAILALSLVGCASLSPEEQMAQIQSIWQEATVIPVNSLPQSSRSGVGSQGYLVIDQVGNVYFVDFEEFTGKRKKEVLLYKSR